MSTAIYYFLLFCISSNFAYNLTKIEIDEYIFQQNLDNFTFAGKTIYYSTPDDTHKNDPVDHTAIQVIIFAATITLIVAITLLLCSLCCKYYGGNQRGLFMRSPSLTSIQELVQDRLQDRPPTYDQSQTHLNILRNDEPPAYEDLVRNREVPSVFTVSKLVTRENDANSFTECDSDSESPPSYHISEGFVNPVVLQSNSHTSTENTLPVNVMHI